jgi:hypothetical protein
MIFLLYLSIPIGIDPVETNEALGCYSTAAEPYARVDQRGDVDLRWRLGCSVKTLGSGSSPLSIRWRLLTWIHEGVLWWTWRDPRVSCYLSDDGEVESNSESSEASAHLCYRGLMVTLASQREA